MPAQRKSTQSTNASSTDPSRRGHEPEQRGPGKLKVTERGRGGAGGPVPFATTFWAAAAGIWIPFVACENFYQNKTNNAITITITIRNTTKDILIVDVSGKGTADIPPGKTRTLVIEIPAGGFLHANQNGEYLV